MSEHNNNGGAPTAAPPPFPLGDPRNDTGGRARPSGWPDAPDGPPRARTVFKFLLDVRDPKLVMPRGAQVLHIAAQPEPGASQPHGTLQVWAEVEVAQGPMGWPAIDDTVVMEQVPVVVFGTGHPMPAQPLAHMGSAIDGPFVWHVFRVLPQ